MPWRPIADSKVSEYEPGAEQTSGLFQLRSCPPDRGAVGQHYVDRQFGCMLSKYLKMRLRRETLSLTWLRRQIQRYQPPRTSSNERRS